MPPKQKTVSSGVTLDKGKGKGKKGKARRVNGTAAVASSTEDAAAVPALDNKRGTMTEKDAAAAIERGDVMSVCAFLGQLFPRSARRNGGELRCMRRGLSLLDSRWKADVDRKRKATFASEDKGMVDAVLMGGFYLPSDSFAMVVEYLDHSTAVRSTPSSKSWWRTISGLPPASHIDTNLGKRLPWGELVTQLKTIKTSNPLRAVARVTLGCRTKLGSFHNLGKVMGGVGLTHLDLTRSSGAKKIDFASLAKALPSLRGLAIYDTFYSSDSPQYWLRQLAIFVHTVKLESLALQVTMMTLTPSNGSGAKWDAHYESKINDAALADLANMPRATPWGWGPGDGKTPSSLRKLRLTGQRGGQAEAPSITTGLGAIGANAPRLEELVVDGLKVTDDGWKRFAAARLKAAAATTAAAARPPVSYSHGGGDGRDTSQSSPPSSSSSSVSSLRVLRIRTNGRPSVPSAATRGLLQDAVDGGTVTLYLNPRDRVSSAGAAAAGGGGSGNSGSGGSGSGGGGGSSGGGGGGGGGGSGSSGSGAGNDKLHLDCEGCVIELSEGKEDGVPSTSGGGLLVVESVYANLSHGGGAERL